VYPGVESTVLPDGLWATASTCSNSQTSATTALTAQLPYLVLEGAMLCGVYVIAALAFFFSP